MTTPEKDGLVIPLLLFDIQGNLIQALVTNEKGYSKSLERNQLWYLDGQTGRLIPNEQIDLLNPLEVCFPSGTSRTTSDSEMPEQPQTIAEKGTWIQARVSINKKSTNLNSTAVPYSNPIDNNQQSQIEAQDHVPPKSINNSEVLKNLELLINSRKQNMPEGSYTTHLFSKGEDKIRKKAGEEAIELLLAKTNEELISESADFLYHLLVLFVEKGIPFQHVLTELESR
jgi:phosphoribosyl-ATP pyrophosphohydrolase